MRPRLQRQAAPKPQRRTLSLSSLVSNTAGPPSLSLLPVRPFPSDANLRILALVEVVEEEGEGEEESRQGEWGCRLPELSDKQKRDYVKSALSFSPVSIFVPLLWLPNEASVQQPSSVNTHGLHSWFSLFTPPIKAQGHLKVLHDFQTMMHSCVRIWEIWLQEFVYPQADAYCKILYLLWVCKRNVITGFLKRSGSKLFKDERIVWEKRMGISWEDW